MNTTPFFLAQRMLFTHVYQKSISTMTLICFAGIFIGSFSLALITAIMHGFEVAISHKMQGIHANLIIQSYGGNGINFPVVSSILTQEFPQITAFSPMITRHILLRTKNNDDTPIVAMIKGIDPITEEHTSTLSHKMIHRMTDITTYKQFFNDNYIIIGKQLARNNNIATGDTIELLFIRDEQIKGKRINFDTQQAVVSGIFDTGIDEFDNGVVYCSLAFLEQLFPNSETEQINVTLQPSSDDQATAQALHHRLGLDVYSWKNLYPSLVATLKLEKYVSFFVLALILLVASMNIISLLFMQITNKRPDIALLKTIGMSHTNISAIFFIIGITISFLASSSGLLCAVIASLVLQHYPFITLPDTYYVTQLPVAMTADIIMAVFCLVMLLTICATLLPLQRIRSINISRVLRFEG
jgi:lipoprotein-releasing system permease protein